MLAEAADNAGRWGTEDALGAPNLITAAVARQAATEVRDGLTLSLAWPFEPARLTLSWPSADAVVDEAVVAPHGETITHLDAPGHIYLHGRSYNNTAPDTNRDRLSRRVDITVGAAGVVTRGVLLDVELLLGARPPVGSYLHGTDLAQAAVAANIAVMPGDALVLHTGAPCGHAANQPSYGLCGCAAGWLHETGTAVYSGDCVERLPFPSLRYPLPFHQLAIARAGIALVDNPRLDALVAACRGRGRRTFAYVLAPPPLLGATGAAVNPLAVL